jgi:N-acetylglucosaminyldiphosphoundecaprenol N-acetyl-beta-D-mannosaminyltransferase
VASTVVSPPAPTTNPTAVPPTTPWVQPPRTKVWDIPFDQITLPESVDKIAELIRRGTPSYVITANLNYVMLHHRDQSLGDVTNDAALILADGQPIVARSRLGTKPLPQRVAGSELIYYLASRAALEGWGIYFLGGAPGVAEGCANKLLETFPGLQIAGVESPPFRTLTEQEQREQDDRIQRSGAKLLLVAFGQPKGEQWIHENHQRLGIPVSIQLGASFDFIAGTAKRAPEFFQKYGLEWSYRMLSDPRRLVPRYWSNAMFLCQALIQDWKRAVTKWGMGDWA